MATLPFFPAHHAPIGAWSSLFFGANNAGAAVAIEALAPVINADLLLAVRRGERTAALPFVRDPAAFSRWEMLGADHVTRACSPCVDEFSAACVGVTLRLFTPHAALPNPKRSGNLQYATAPGVLMEMVIDNSHSDEAATAFIGIGMGDGEQRLRPLDWSNRTLCGIASAGGGGANWILAAAPVKGEVHTVLSRRLAQEIAGGASAGGASAALDPTATQGGIAVHVAPRAQRTVTLAFATYQSGLVTHGIDARYWYAIYFPRIEAVVHFLLNNAGRIKESCASLDSRAAAVCADPARLALFARALRAYDAQTQLLDAGQNHDTGFSTFYFATIAPDTGARNSLERAMDFLPWELTRNPWVVRNVFDLATSAYAYHDQLRFPDDVETPTEPRAGGMTFARDFGYGSLYAPSSANTQTPGPGWSGGQHASESLLNAVYLLTSYALVADDTPWAKTRLPFARELLASLENRDHWDPEKRTGVLKAESLGAGANRVETTAFAGMHPSLSEARGSFYMTIKTFCANLMLTTYFQQNNDLHSADYSYAFAQKTAQALLAAFDPAAQAFPANLLHADSPARLLAALEPLALPTFLGLTTTLPEYFPDLFAALRAHAQTCLKPAPEGCAEGNILRLSSATSETLPAKLVSVLYVLEKLFQLDVRAYLPSGDGASDPARLLTAALFVKLA